MVRTKASESERESTVGKIDKIFQGAMQEFLAHGYAGASMDRVASQAGVSKATVYSHFKDKEGLFKALIHQLATEKFQNTFATLPLDGEPAVVLRTVITKALDKMMSDTQHQAFLRVLIAESGRFPELAKAWIQDIMTPTIEIFGEYLDRHPELNIPDTEATIRIVIGSMVHFMMTQEIFYGKEIMPMESDRMVDCLMHHLLRGMD
ncbi:TetR/AcrR family transcriptional regulator [Brunnivagina elsteri]|uniref:TetR family transcriptional regulator n=1 Tax=Brunnivagina elsteri CCALA 953 TaxID=987040 RepID=A0A2A2TAE4_9CYAN|nr:TetR/AcrR family transcriptional regulator [Calothrix elsteri]PAX45679.1 TetR family transcriptional regulator [Calothrix elsteri CCALA 953]